MATVTFTVPDEVKQALDAVAALVKGVKKAEGVAQIFSEVLPGLLAAAPALANFSADLKDPVVRAYLAYALEQDVEAAVAPAPAPAV